jgi:2,4-dienoyl-CoA reductase-like NADH-dependent reductase (Old Yellow Enzyme family)
MSFSVTDRPDDARPLLFQPFKIRGLTLKNRLVVPPMVHYRAGPGYTCGSFHNVHLGRYALGGFGLVFVEATAVEEVGLINEHDLGIWNDAQAQSFKPLIAFMKGENTAIGIQLAHGGRKSSSQRAMDGMGPLTAQDIKAGARVWQPVGPTSEPVAPGWLTPHALTTEECKAMVRTWAAAARRAVAAGFDVIEIHTAHGYLLASFLSPVPTPATMNMAATARGACACRSRSSKRCGAKCPIPCRCSSASPPSTAPRVAGIWTTR